MTQPLDDRVTAAVRDALRIAARNPGADPDVSARLVASAVLAEVHRQPTAAEVPARHTADSITDDALDDLYTQLAEQQHTARVLSALHRSAEETVSRVIALAERWQHTADRKDGPLRELRTALTAEQQHP